MPGAFKLNNDDHDYEDKLWSSESGCVIWKKKKRKRRKGNKETSKRGLDLKINTLLFTKFSLFTYIPCSITCSFVCMFKNFALALQVQGNSFQKKVALLFGLGHHAVEVNVLLDAKSWYITWQLIDNCTICCLNEFKLIFCLYNKMSSFLLLLNAMMRLFCNPVLPSFFSTM